MKLNFWQIVGGLLIVVGIIGIVWFKEHEAAPKPPIAPGPTTLPDLVPPAAPTTSPTP